tara:strand:+ start:54 stop:1127 length:1074 start_codon:yes stop_codon:yes gene_type:complete
MLLFNLKTVKKTFFLIFIFLLINLLSIKSVNAISFVVNDLLIEKKYDKKFTRDKVYNLAFKKAFNEIMLKIVSTSNQNKISDTTINTIKSLIDSFNIYDEKFIENKYTAKVDVTFNKKNTLMYLETKNIFPSIPKKVDIFFLPIIVDSEKNDLLLFGKNSLYSKWDNSKKSYHLIQYIMPQEDIDYIKVLKKELDNLEGFDFENFAKQYELKNFIISIIYIDEIETRILSKIKINDNLKILNKKIKKINFKDKDNLSKVILNLKNDYEDQWKILNQINTSIKLPITLSVSSKDMHKVFDIEKKLKDIDLISEVYIQSFDAETIIFKIIFNGSPNQFLSSVSEKNINFEKDESIWRVK